MTKFVNPKVEGLFLRFDKFDELEISDCIGTMTHEEACKHRIPTKDELHYLIACGALEPGDSEIWSSSMFPQLAGYAWSFYGDLGLVEYKLRSAMLQVRIIKGVENTTKKEERLEIDENRYLTPDDLASFENRIFVKFASMYQKHRQQKKQTRKRR